MRSGAAFQVRDHGIVMSARRIVVLIMMGLLQDATDSVDSRDRSLKSDHRASNDRRKLPAGQKSARLRTRACAESYLHQLSRMPEHQPRLSAPGIIEPSGHGDRSKAGWKCQARSDAAPAQKNRRIKGCGHIVDETAGRRIRKGCKHDGRCLTDDGSAASWPLLVQQARKNGLFGSTECIPLSTGHTNRLGDVGSQSWKPQKFS